MSLSDVPPRAAFVQQVGEAFKNSASVLALSRSPLAAGPLVNPGLVLDELSPTLDERGMALRLALQWAVEELAPEPPAFPFGHARPLDDPTWRDPHWWRYTILRHRYLEPLHPDDFVEGGRFTETLLALTGMPSADLLFDERSRALRDAAHWLERQLADGRGSERIQALALQAVLEPLQEHRPVLALLGIASVFAGVFPRTLLLEMAAEEIVRYPDRALDLLVARRCLHVGDGEQSLWMSPVLRAHVVARQPAEQQQRRHLFAARAARESEHPVRAARHLLDAGMAQQAARILLALSDDQQNEAAPDLIALLRRFTPQQVEPAQARDLSLLLADLCQRSAQIDDALAACRDALRHVSDPADQALIYRRMGKLYEEQNQAQALTYYQMALDRLPPDHPELGALLKDRGWLAILRREWEAAEADLARALTVLPRDETFVRADVYDALSSLRRGRGEYPAAVEYARSALALREAAGDLMRVGKSFNILGILFRFMGEYGSAISAYREAQAIFERLDNQALAATALLNIGTAYHFSEMLAEAEQYYRQCLALADEVGLPLTEVRARSNLCEALMDQGREEEARLHWRAGYSLSQQSGFDDELAYLRELCERYPALASELAELDAGALARAAAQSARESGAQVTPQSASAGGAAGELPLPSAHLDDDEHAALSLAQRAGRISATTLMAAAHVSKATATRKLARLTETGLLTKHGQGRGTYYTRAHQVPAVLVAGDLAGLQARLDAVLPRFAEKYALERLEAKNVVQTAAPGGAGEVRYDVRAVFRRLPDLQGFFDLERALGDSSRTVINLVL